MSIIHEKPYKIKKKYMLQKMRGAAFRNIAFVNAVDGKKEGLIL